MRKRGLFFPACVLGFVVVAVGCAAEVKADLKPLKVKSITVGAPEGTTQSQVDVLQTAITGELLKRGAVMDEGGVDISIRTEIRAKSIILLGQAVDPAGVSISIAGETPNWGYSHSEIARRAAVRFGDEAAEQIAAQMDKGRHPAGTIKTTTTADPTPLGPVTSSVTAGK